MFPDRASEYIRFLKTWFYNNPPVRERNLSTKSFHWLLIIITYPHKNTVILKSWKTLCQSWCCWNIIQITKFCHNSDSDLSIVKIFSLWFDLWRCELNLLQFDKIDPSDHRISSLYPLLFKNKNRFLERIKIWKIWLWFHESLTLMKKTFTRKFSNL